MSVLPRGSRLVGCLASVLMVAPLLAACAASGEPRDAGAAVFPRTETPAPLPSVQPSATAFMFDPLVESNLDLWAGPVEVPLVLEIPALGVTAPVLGVGLTPENVMDSPRGPLGDPIWSAAYWYRGGGIPGSPGTATIAGHVNDPLGDPEIFARLEDLVPGDVIIIQLKHTTVEIRFTVDETRVYPVEESSQPAVLERVFGAGPVAGIGPLPSPDGRSHLTLITCAGFIRNGAFDHHTVVFATRSN